MPLIRIFREDIGVGIIDIESVITHGSKTTASNIVLSINVISITAVEANIMETRPHISRKSLLFFVESSDALSIFSKIIRKRPQRT